MITDRFRGPGLAACVVVAATGCVDNNARYLYGWDHDRVLCSAPLDDDDRPGDPGFVDDTFRLAADGRAVATLHAHVPGETISTTWLETVLQRADAHALDYVTYDELISGPPHPSFALAFDDQSIDAWYEIGDQLAAHGARATFFVTRWEGAWTDEGRGKLAELYARGHDVEPHSVDHLHARAYVAEHGLDAYLTDEVIPSIEGLRAAGYPPTTFAFPFGESSPEITQAVLEHIDRVRVGPSSCPK